MSGFDAPFFIPTAIIDCRSSVSVPAALTLLGKLVDTLLGQDQSRPVSPACTRLTRMAAVLQVTFNL